jgi:hypothetical protein
MGRIVFLYGYIAISVGEAWHSFPLFGEFQTRTEQAGCVPSKTHDRLPKLKHLESES